MGRREQEKKVTGASCNNHYPNAIPCSVYKLARIYRWEIVFMAINTLSFVVKFPIYSL